jgi:hypothetical protein
MQQHLRRHYVTAPKTSLIKSTPPLTAENRFAAAPSDDLKSLLEAAEILRQHALAASPGCFPIWRTLNRAKEHVERQIEQGLNHEGDVS